MVNKKTFPGWGYMIENNATTVWEQWNGQNSHIHNCYLSIGAWFINGLGGIRPHWQNPGFEHFTIEPGIVDELDYVETSYQSIKGTIISQWQRIKDDLHIQIRIPNNTRATLVLPRKKWQTVIMNDTIFTLAKLPESLELDPGRYSIWLK
jgi:alpha-L-rhamnosidase